MVTGGVTTHASASPPPRPRFLLDAQNSLKLNNWLKAELPCEKCSIRDGDRELLDFTRLRLSLLVDIFHNRPLNSIVVWQVDWHHSTWTVGMFYYLYYIDYSLKIPWPDLLTVWRMYVKFLLHSMIMKGQNSSSADFSPPFKILYLALIQ